MDATDFVPNEIDIDVLRDFLREDIKNFAEPKPKNEDIINNTKKSIEDYEDRFSSQRQGWISEDTGIWNLCDWAFRSCLNDISQQNEKIYGANVPDVWERAQTGTTQFHRQVAQLAANGYSIQRSKEMPFKYSSITNSAIDESEEDSKKRERQMNLLAKWTMKQDRFNHKSKEFWTQVNKYGNIPVMVEWMRETGRKLVQIKDENGRPELVEQTGIVKNRPELRILQPEAVMADVDIGNIQDQEAVIVLSLVGMGEIIDLVEQGVYTESVMDDIGIVHQWDGSSGFENKWKKKKNRELDDNSITANTGKYLKREVFIRLPINEEKEKWDEKKYKPELYRVTLLGNTPSESVVARIERNQEPDDTIPVEIIHSNPDDSDLLYHISKYEVIRSNISTETTLIRQALDNNALVCKPPLIERRGEVDGNDRKFGPNARWTADGTDSIREFNVRDISNTTLGILNYLKDDSNTANNIDKNMVGESFGARTSAQEAGTIAGNSRRPNIVGIEYVLDQFLGFYAQRIKVNWEAYGLPEQIVQITDEEDNLVRIPVSGISGDYDIVIDSVTELKNKEDAIQDLSIFIQTVAATPMAQSTDWEGLNRDIQEKILGTSKYVKSPIGTDAEQVARNNVLQMVEFGQVPEITQGMDLKKHLEIYKGERLRWKGYEDQNPNITGVLENVIAQIELMISQNNQQQLAVQAQGVSNAVQ